MGFEETGTKIHRNSTRDTVTLNTKKGIVVKMTFRWIIVKWIVWKGSGWGWF